MNGKKARVKKSTQSCSNCLPARHGNCHNGRVARSHLRRRHLKTRYSRHCRFKPHLLSAHRRNTQKSPPPPPPPASQAQSVQTHSTQSQNELPDTQSLPVLTTTTVIPSFQCSSCGTNLASKKIHKHMQEHAFGKITGEVPSTWLVENSLFICQNCSN